MNKIFNDPLRFTEDSKLKLTSFDISQIHLHQQYLYMQNTEK